RAKTEIDQNSGEYVKDDEHLFLNEPADMAENARRGTADLFYHGSGVFAEFAADFVVFKQIGNGQEKFIDSLYGFGLIGQLDEPAAFKQDTRRFGKIEHMRAAYNG